jgi:RNA polymerase sigma-70 factor, ECF subfamily
MTKVPSTKILLYRIRKNKDPEAYGQIYDIYVKQIYRFVYYKISNHEEAEDLTSEVFLKAWNYLNEGNEIKNIKALLYQLARNLVIDLYRKRSSHREIKIEQIEIIQSPDESNEKRLEDKLEHQKIVKNLDKLKNEYKEVIILKYIEGLKTSEIAKIMNKSRASVRVLSHRALKKLKFIMEK